MPRTVIAPVSIPLTAGGAYPNPLPIAAGGADIVFTNADTVNGNAAVITNLKTFLLAFNTDTVAQTVTITSAPDTLNRKGDITAYSIAAGKVSLFGPFPTAGWNNSDGLEFTGSAATVHFAVLNTP